MKIYQIIFIGLIIISFPGCNCGSNTKTADRQDENILPIQDTLRIDTCRLIPLPGMPYEKTIPAGYGPGWWKRKKPPIVVTPPPPPTGTSDTAVIYVDANGYDLPSGSAWNGGQALYCAPPAMTTDQIDQAVYQAYRLYAQGSYKVNVTTDEAVYNNAINAIRVVLTSTSSWAAPGYSGFTYVGSMFYGKGNVCWVFSDRLQNSAKYCGDIIAHESGHAIALHHQSECNGGTVSVQYSPGKIMGTPFNVPLALWYDGIDQYCQPQNDPVILNNTLGK